MQGRHKRTLEMQPQLAGAAVSPLATFPLAAFPWEQEAAQSEPDTWLLSFVDVLTLLLTLFVLLLAYQKTANEELQGALTRVPARIEQAGQPPTPAAREQLPTQISTATVPQPEQAPEDRDRAAAAEADAGAAAKSGESDVSPDYLALFDQQSAPATADWLPTLISVSAQDAVNQTPVEKQTLPALDTLLAQLISEGLQERIEITRSADQVNLEISDSILFEPASAALTDSGTALLDGLLPVLLSGDYQLSVEGHTDNVPIKSDRFPSNWELSAARATTVTRHLIGIGLLPERIRAVGYADTRPLADNADAAGRARNRRVSFVLQQLVVTSTPAVR